MFLFQTEFRRDGKLNSRTERILLVEDDPRNVELIQMALEPFHLNELIDVVTDGEQALQHLHEQDEALFPRSLPRLVLLDLKLPRVSGVQVLRTIRANPRTRRLIVVMMTSSQEDADLNACYDLGANSYIVKPLDFQQFLETIQNVVSYWMHLNKPPLLVI